MADKSAATTIRFTPAHRFVVDVVAQAEDVTPAEAVRRIIERYARGFVEVEDPENQGRDYTLWHAAVDGDMERLLPWAEQHGDPSSL